MKTTVLDNISFEMDVPNFAKLLHIEEGSDNYEDFVRLAKEAQKLAGPKAMYGLAYIESRGEDFVVIDGITFKSRVLAVNLENDHKVFPSLATCGVELHDWGISIDDALYRFWAEGIMGMALFNAVETLDNHIRENFGISKIAYMSPGSLQDWPLEEQKPLFKLISDSKQIGIELLDSCLMTPTKTVSRILFATESSFESCMLCPRDQCPGRRAPYDREMYDKKYRKK
jgi:hypothetical protein